MVFLGHWVKLIHVLIHKPTELRGVHPPPVSSDPVLNFSRFDFVLSTAGLLDLN